MCINKLFQQNTLWWLPTAGKASSISVRALYLYYSQLPLLSLHSRGALIIMYHTVWYGILGFNIPLDTV